MSNIVAYKEKIPAMTNDEIDKAYKVESFLREQHQEVLETNHVIHGGVYYRSIKMYAGEVICGVIIKIPTTVIISGSVDVYVGDDIISLNGYNVIPAEAGRKQVVAAKEDVNITMCFPTDAKTVEEAENQFTDEADMLQSRTNMSINTTTITGV